MKDASLNNKTNVANNRTRRNFLIYAIGSSLTSVALGYLFPKPSHSRELDLETLCSLFPQNSRCQNYLPGVEAKDTQGKVIQANAILATATPGIPFLVKGLPNNAVDYLIIKDGPQIAEYAINPTCTHMGCTVEWNQEKNHFICPCHGSQYDALGKVVKGPAGRSLPLITVIVKQNQVRLVETKPAIDPR